MGLAIVIPAILAATAAGAVSEVRFGERAERACDRMLSLSLYVLIPPVVFFNVARLEFRPVLGLALALAWAAILLTGAIAYAIARPRWSRPVTGTVIVAAIAANTGYLGYPLVTILLGAERLPEAVLYDVVVSVPVLVLLCFAVGAAFGENAGETVRERVRSFFTRNPILPAFALGLVAPDALAPDVLVDVSRALVFAMLPVGFFAVGAYLAATSPGRFELPLPTPPALVAIGLRLLVAPGVFLVLTLPLAERPVTYAVLAAMPCGLNTLLVANAYGLDRRLAAATIAWSTLAALAAAGVAVLAGL